MIGSRYGPRTRTTTVLATHDPEAAAKTDATLALDEGVATWVRRL